MSARALYHGLHTTHVTGLWLLPWLLYASAACSKSQPAAAPPNAQVAAPAAAPSTSAAPRTAVAPARKKLHAPNAAPSAQQHLEPAAQPAKAPLAERDDESPTAAQAGKPGRVNDDRCRVGGPNFPDGSWFGAVFRAERDHIVFDVMCLFTGDEAKRAAAEDYHPLPAGETTYIRNYSLRTRNVAVDGATTVTWLTRASGTQTQSGSYAAWLDVRAKHGYGGPPVTLQVAQGKLRRIVEQSGQPAFGEVVAAAYLGTGPNDLAVDWEEEARSVGPTSLAVTWDERRVYLLDPPGHYIAVFENGKWVDRLPMPKDDLIEDIGVLPNGDLVLVDGYDNGRLFVIDPKGSVVRELPLRAKAEPGTSFPGTLVMSRDGAWMEIGESGESIRFLDRDGNVDTARPRVKGTPTLDGKRLLRAEVNRSKQSPAVRVSLCDRSNPDCTHGTTLHFAHSILGVRDCGVNPSGRLSIVTSHDWRVGSAERSELLMNMLSPELELEHQFRVEDRSIGLYLVRDVVSAASGAMYLLDFFGPTHAVVVRRFR